MKKIIIGTVAVIIAFSAAAQKEKKALAEQAPAAAESIGRKEKKQNDLADEFAGLQLTDEQRSKLEGINNSYKEQLKTLEQETYPEEDKRKNKMMMIRKRQEQIVTVLTDEQLNQWETLKRKNGAFENSDDNRLEKYVRLRKELDFSPEQNKRMDEMKKNLTVKIKDLLSEFDKNFNEMLTPEQQNKLMEINKSRENSESDK